MLRRRRREVFTTSLVVATLTVLLHGQVTKRRFEVTSVKPRSLVDGPTQGSRSGQLEMPNDTVWTVIRFAYDLATEAQVVGQLPDWAYTEPWSISGKSADAVPNDQLRVMTQSLQIGSVSRTERSPRCKPGALL